MTCLAMHFNYVVEYPIYWTFSWRQLAVVGWVGSWGLGQGPFLS